MKTLITIATLLSLNSAFAGQTLMADCVSKDKPGYKMCLYHHLAQGEDRFEPVWGQFESCEKLGPKAIASTFTPEDIQNNTNKEFRAKTGSRYLGFGTKVKFELNKVKKTAVVKGYADSPIFGPPSNVDLYGRFKFKFESCDLTQREVPWFWEM